MSCENEINTAKAQQSLTKYRAKQTNQSEPTYIPQSELYFRNKKIKQIANAAQAYNILHGIIKNIPNVIQQSDHTTN